MNDNALVPNAVEAAVQDDAMAALTPDLAVNYAENGDVVRYIQQHLLPVLTWTRSERSALEDEWAKVRNMVVLQHDEGQRYKGRSNAYIPAYARARTTVVSQLARGLFPSDDYLNAEGKEGAEEEDVRAAVTLMKHQVKKSARLRHGIKPCLRQFFDYGIAVAKVMYRGKEANLKRIRRNLLDLSALQFGPDESSNYRCSGVKFIPRNIFFWYVYPNTAMSIEDAQVVFEDILVPLSMVKEKVEKKQWLNGQTAMHAPTPSNYSANLAAILEANAEMPSTPEATPLGSDIGSIRVLTEVWVSMPLPKAAYAQGEDPGSPVPCKVVLAGDTPVEVRRNPFWDQLPPYVMARDEWEVESFYPRGTGHKAKGYQYLLNDFSNQLNDNGTYALNPIVKANPSLFTGPITPLRPGAMWQGTDVDGMAKFDRPPVEQLQHGLQIVLHIASMLESHTGALSILQGTGTGRGGKTATGSQILQRNALNPLQDTTEDLEEALLVPFMVKAWALMQQYMSPEEMFAVAGRDLKVSKEMLDRDYEFSWLASSQSANQQLRAQQLMQLLQAVATPGMLQLLGQFGKTINPELWLRRLASDGFGLRGFDQVVVPLPQAPQMPGAPMPGGPQLGGPMPGEPTPGERIRSATEQANEVPTNASPVPGEGDDFMAVRAQADQLAGMLGGGQ